MSADLEQMAAAFNTTVPELENELMTLILDGQIQARIDSHNKVCSRVFISVSSYCLTEKVIFKLMLFFRSSNMDVHW